MKPTFCHCDKTLSQQPSSHGARMNSWLQVITEQDNFSLQLCHPDIVHVQVAMHSRQTRRCFRWYAMSSSFLGRKSKKIIKTSFVGSDQRGFVTVVEEIASEYLAENDPRLLLNTVVTGKLPDCVVFFLFSFSFFFFLKRA